MNNINVFEEIKHRTDIKEVAEQFGVRINKHGKALCFAHNDNHPSLSFKDNYYKCFSCGVSGDVISMVCHIRGVQPIEAARIIDSIYGFGLFKNKIDTAELKRQMKQIESDKQLIESFKVWELNTFIMLSNRYRELRSRRNLILEQHIKELAELPLLEYLLDEMIFNTSDINKQIEFYKSWKGTVKKYEQFNSTSKYSA